MSRDGLQFLSLFMRYLNSFSSATRCVSTRLTVSLGFSKGGILACSSITLASHSVVWLNCRVINLKSPSVKTKEDTFRFSSIFCMKNSVAFNESFNFFKARKWR